MQIGALGDIVFQVSAEQVKTIDKMVWAGQARYAKQDRHLNDSLTEFTGLEPDTISFEIMLSAYLGTDPYPDIVKIWQYERSGKALPLVIGERTYGKWRWVIEKHQIKMQNFDKTGNLLSATVSVDLLEYLKS